MPHSTEKATHADLADLRWELQEQIRSLARDVSDMLDQIASIKVEIESLREEVNP